MFNDLIADFAQLIALHTDDLICVHEPDGSYLYLTPSCQDLLGYDPAELVGSTPYFLFHPDDVEAIRSGPHALALQGVTNVHITYRMRKKSGGYIWLETLTRPILDEAGNVLLIVTTSRDITQRRLVEKQLSTNEQLLETFFSQSLDACFIKLLPRPLNWQDEPNREAAIEYALFNLRITKVNDATCTMYRAGRERLLGLCFGDMFRKDLDQGRQLLKALFHLGRFQTELHLQRLDNTWMWVDCNFVCLYDERGWIRGCFDVKKDITERKETRIKLEEAYAAVTNVLESTTDGFFSVDQDWSITYVNHNFEQTLKTKRQNILGKNFWELFPDARGTLFESEYSRAFRENLPVQFEEFYPGTQHWYAVRAYPTEQGLSIYFQNVTEQKLAELQLAETNNRLTTVLESTTDGFFNLNSDWLITYCNSKFEETVGLGKEQLIGHNLWELFSDAVGTPFELKFKQALVEQVPIEVEEFYPGLGRWFYVKAYPVDSGLAVYFQDVTNRRIAEAKLAEVNQELSSVLESTTDAFISVDQQGMLTYINRNFERRTGLTRAQLLGHTPWEVFPDLEHTAFFQAIEQAQGNHQPQKVEYFCPYTQTWFLANIYPTPGGFSIYLQDVTAQKKREAERQRQSDLTELLLRLSIQVRESLEVPKILQTTVDEVRQFLDVNRVIVYQFLPDWSGKIVAEAVDNPDYALLNQIIYDPCFGASQVGPYRLGRISQVMNIHDSDMNPCYVEFLAQFQVQANLVVPIIYQDQLLGLLIAQHCQQPRAWQEDEVNLLKQLATQVGIAVSRAKLVTALKEQEARYRAIVEDQTELIYRCSSDGILTFANAAFCRYLHLIEPGEIKADQCYFDQAVRHPFNEVETARFAQQLAALTPAHPVSSIECAVDLPSGDQAWYEWTMRALYDSANQLREYQCLGREITRRKKVEFQLIHDALYDSLTGLPNRVLLLERLNQAWNRYRRHPDCPFVLLFIDVDRFKRINDSLGHQAGDQILMTLAERLQVVLRATDTLARLSGDEFVLLAEDINPGIDLDHLIGRLQQTAEQPITIYDNLIKLTLSIGVAWSSEAYSQPDELLRDADIAMYQAKRRGRHQCLTFTPEMHLEARFTLSLESELRSAILTAQTRDPLLLTESELAKELTATPLQIYYQPIVDLSSRHVIGLEALCRWFHPRRGVISPSEFIPLAEETGLILPLGQWVLKTAVAHFSQWYQTLGPGNIPKLSVNLAPQQFLQSNLVNDVADILETYDLPPKYLHLEITETAMMTSLDVVVRVARQLQDLGVFLNIDDFGTGYSSLSRLHQLPIQALKIDRSFVLRLDPDIYPLWDFEAPIPSQASGDIIQAMLSLGQSLEMDVIAELPAKGALTVYQFRRTACC
ncbi:PAS domain-containing protein [Synechococcus sp. PCC 6312]|uniref:bifunctional diguanylate cyclase/phosphodiesterase n=1 Tax=Synechococcus sp. (strain ATCC 27167 / PCC 6312) TaxID=195253 RepID=UPI00029EE646|nr:PAS domain-containing protein [Synechococcus sp. PCC 6312]AFY61594.1 PAS domain S-box/diguanylate cyclase (GGDEF) domain-containing protein [Synechococcus sp. PCC 6312]